jgi:predicted Zn-dependent protease with MMP-like domain
MPKRRRGSRTGRPTRALRARRLAARPPDDLFERVVEGVLAEIPPPFDRALDEVAIVIEDEPTLQQRRDNDLRGDETLYGLYEGVPRIEWGADAFPIPNKISLFRIPLEEDFPDLEDLADEIRVTILHELAHHLGIDDERLDELGME